MIESFVNARKFYYASRQDLEPKLTKLVTQCREEISAAMTAAESSTSSDLNVVGEKNPHTPMSSRPSGTPSGSSRTRSSMTTGGGAAAAPQQSMANLSAPAHPSLPIPLALFPTNASGVPCPPLPGTPAFMAAQKITTALPPATLWTLHNLTSTKCRDHVSVPKVYAS
jgi:hypothetical protein